METSDILLAVILFLGATAICVLLFESLGFGSVLGFIVAGVVIGPHTPGPITTHNVHELEAIAELGVVLFMFTIGLELRPEKLWSMRRLLFGLGTAQMLFTAAVVGAYAFFVVGDPRESALVLGLGLALSSTAIGMTTLAERGGLSTEHGKTSFAILMAQDIWIVPIMALIPLLALTPPDEGPTVPAWQTAAMIVGAVAGIFVVGRYVLPAALARMARQRLMEAFGVLLFLAVLAAAWAMHHVGISMTLGAFMMGMLLSVSDYRFQIEAMVDPFKNILMGLFFIAVGMSIDIQAMLDDWPQLLVHVPIVVTLKLLVLLGLGAAFGVSRAAVIRTGFYLSQAGEFAFVLFGAAGVLGLLSPASLTMAMLVVAVSMIVTPLLVKAGDALSARFGDVAPKEPGTTELENHVVVVGYDQVGKLVCFMLEKEEIPYVAFDVDLAAVEQGKRLGKNVHFGDMYSPVTQEAAGLERAAAAFVSSTEDEGMALTLTRLHPSLAVFARGRTLREQQELVAKGVHHADTGFIEGGLNRGSALLQHLGVTQTDIDGLVEDLRRDSYAVLQTAEAEFEPQSA